MIRRLGPVAPTLAVAAAGSAAALALGLPAAPLVGAAIAVAAGTLAGARLETPDALRNAGFTAIGCSLGAGITPEALGEAERWLGSLAIMVVALALMVLAASRLLQSGFGIARDTAVLASSPGALSYALALAAERKRDVPAVAVLQTIRLLLITIVLPFLVAPAAADGAARADGAAPMGLPEALALVAAAFALGRLAERMGAPAAHLVAGLALSGLLHATGIARGGLPDALLLAGLCVTGAVVGARLRRLPPAALRRLAVAATAVTACSTAIAAAAAGLAAGLLGIPFAQAWIAYAPGGVEAMAAMAVSLGVDPAFVAVHHLVRILGLILAMPFLLSRGRDAPGEGGG